MNKSTRRYNNEFQKMRKKVIERDGGRCVMCGARACHVHHIVFRSAGGTNDMSNLVSLCYKCHFEAHGIYSKRIREFLRGLIYDRYDTGGTE